MHLQVLAPADTALPSAGPSPLGPDWELCSFSSPATPYDPHPRPARVLPPAALPEPRQAPPRPLRPGRGLGVRVDRTAHARRRGRGLPAPRAPSGRNPRAAAPPGAARSRPRPDPRRPGGACFLGPRTRARGREGTFLALPARLRPFPLLPRRVFSAPVKIVPHK